MKVLSKVLLLVLAVSLLSACGKDRTREQKVSAIISKINSPFVIANVNLQNLMDKSAVMEEGTLPFTQYQVLSFFLAKEVTGIDYDTDAQFIMGKGESFIPNFYGIFKVKDEALFVELLEVEANAKIEEKDGMKYAIKDSEGYCVVWNEEFAIISNIPMDLAAFLSGKKDGGQKMVDKNIELIKAAEEGEINEEYVAFMEKGSDIAIAFDGEPFYNYLESVSMEDNEELEKMKDLYEGMSSNIYLNFEKGKVVMEFDVEMNEDLKEELSFIADKGANKNLFSYGKSKSPLFSSTYNMKLDGFFDYYEGMSEDAYNKLIDEMDKMGLGEEDITKSFSGDILFMIENVRMKEEVYDFGYDEPIVIKNEEPVFGLVIGVKDKSIIETKLQELMLAESIEDLIASTDADIQMDPEMDLPKIEVLENGVIKIDDGFMFLGKSELFMTNDEEWANLIASGKGVEINNPDEILTNDPFGMYADLTRLQDMESMKDEDLAMAKILKAFYGSSNLEGGVFTLELTDASENALKIITKMIGETMAEMDKLQNPDLEAELEEAIDNPDALFDQLEEEIEDGEIEEVIELIEEK